MSTMSYNVYTAEFISGQRNHVRIFIETNPTPATVTDPIGIVYHVIGTILMGMEYQKRDSQDPLHSATFVPGTKKKVGTIAEEDVAKFETECCEAISPPAPQVKLNGTRLDPSKPLYRCGEWVEDVKRLAFEKGIFKP
ncbi:hypothetical protein BJX76DRAFT_337570 [Aspergillus varians]